MTAGLLDTDLLLAYRNGGESVVTLLTEVRQAGRLEISQVSALALLAWCQDQQDRNAIDAFLYLAVIHPVTVQISRRAFALMSRLAPPVLLTPLDALIAATALAHKLPLYALGPARFAAVPGLSALPPY
jgi:predicted nucleic acid-binding protein